MGSSERAFQHAACAQHTGGSLRSDKPRPAGLSINERLLGADVGLPRLSIRGGPCPPRASRCGSVASTSLVRCHARVQIQQLQIQQLQIQQLQIQQLQIQQLQIQQLQIQQLQIQQLQIQQLQPARGAGGPQPA